MKTYSYLMFFLILFLFAATSCEDKVIDQGFALGHEYSFEVNKSYTSVDGHYSLIINELSDSRCPDCAVCIWSGEVTIKGEWVVYGKKSTFEIHSVVSQENKQPDNYTIQIIDAKPYPKCNSSQKPEDSVLTLLVKAN